MKFTVINGPNLGRLGSREPQVYGSTTLAQLQDQLLASAAEKDIRLEFVQHNSEGAIVDAVETAADTSQGIVINPGGYSHTSVAILDAIKACGIPAVEVHISNVHAREEIRHKLVTAAACLACISGCGLLGYEFALQLLSAKCGEK